MTLLLSAWLLWVALQILLLLLAGLLGGGTRTNGLWIRVSADTRSRLTDAELAAVSRIVAPSTHDQTAHQGRPPPTTNA